MNFKKISFLSLLFIGFSSFLISCGQSRRNETLGYDSEAEGYEDGKYCADIDYYYSETGTRSRYTLNVEIENNELTIIYWPNGGRLDNSHFSPPDISDGEASFTSDRDIYYNVKIIGNEGDCSISSFVIDEDELVSENEENKERILQEEEDEEKKIRQEEEEEEIAKKKKAEEEDEDERRRKQEEEEE